MSIPEKWAIKNCLEAANWFNEKTGYSGYITETVHENNYLHSHNNGNAEVNKQAVLSFSSHIIRENFTEITLEQFRKYVMKVESPSVENYDYLIPLLKQLNIT